MHPVIPDLTEAEMSRAFSIIADRRAGRTYRDIAAQRGMDLLEVTQAMTRFWSVLHVDLRNTAHVLPTT